MILAAAMASAAEIADPASALVTGMADGVRDAPVSSAVRLLVMLTGLSFLPAMLLVMTPFVRFVVVLSLLRQALGVQQAPPNQVIVGLSLFLSLMVMEPTLHAAWAGGIGPYLAGAIDAQSGIEGALGPLRDFMLDNTRRSDLATVLEVGRIGRPDSLDAIPTSAVASAFVLSELKTAFLVSVYVFVPFVVIDLVVSSVLLGMGMMMLPPVVISLPIKLAVFVLMDGWSLLVRDLVAGVAT
jgi:flagellar biosynthetic protein FliP